ncbi:MAG: PAS domain S-box protein [Bacteroidales bacterium]|nr:PAS domain S-box protein [Bacteroidales bacterium]
MSFEKTRNRLSGYIFLLILMVFAGLLYFPKSIFGNRTHDTLIVKNLIDSASIHKKEYSLALSKVDSALTIAQGIHNEQLLANAYMIKGNIYKHHNDLIKADSCYVKSYFLWQGLQKQLPYLKLLKNLSATNYYLAQNKNMLQYSLEGLEYSKDFQNKAFEGVFNNLSGIAMDNLGNPDKALSYYLSALNIFTATKEKIRIASVETNIGNIYQGKKEYQKAEKHYMNALRQALELKDTNLISASYNNLGIVNSGMNQPGKAKKFMLDGLKLSRLMGDNYALANSLTNLGELYADMHKQDSALYYYNAALDLSRKVNDTRIEYYVLSNLAEYYGQIKMTKKAIEYAKSAFEIANKGGTIKEQLYVMKLLNLFYAKLGNYKKVHELLTDYIALNDSLYAEEMASQLTIIETQNQIRGKSRELLLEHEASKRREAYFFIAILILLFSVGIMVFLFERKRTLDTEQKRQKAYLDALLQESESYVSVIDKDTRNTYVSPSYLRVFGRSDEDRVGRSPFDYVHPDDLELLKNIQHRLESGNLVRENVLFRLKNNKGEYRVVRGIIKRVSERSFLEGFIINFWDVTEIQKSAQALKESEEKYRNIFDAFPDIYFKVDHDGIVTEISPSVTKITGYPPREVIGQPIYNFIPASLSVEKARSLFLRFRKLTDFNIDLTGKDGRKIHCSLSAHLVHNEQGNPPAIEGILRDITSRVESERELKLSERQLKEANLSKDKLLSLISHDVRGAIGTQKAILSMVSEDMENFSKEEIVSLILTIKKSVESTYSLVENLLSWARIMRDNIKTEILDNNIYAVVEDVFDGVKEQAEGKQISLHYEGRKDIKGMFDTTLMTAVIRNLLTNSIKFSNPGSRVKVSVSENDRTVDIQVRDWGMGLTADEISKILTGKENIQSKLGTRNEKGTGLGMIIVREFIAMNNGELSIESEPGKGTEFTISIAKSK